MKVGYWKMDSVMGLNHTQPRQVPSTPPLKFSLLDHFLKRIPTEAESMVVQLLAAQAMANTASAKALKLLFIYIIGITSPDMHSKDVRRSARVPCASRLRARPNAPAPRCWQTDFAADPATWHRNRAPHLSDPPSSPHPPP